MPPHTGHDARHAGRPPELRRSEATARAEAVERQREGEGEPARDAEGTASMDDRRGMGRRGMDAPGTQAREADQYERRLNHQRT